jgi:hypothetical protein
VVEEKEEEKAKKEEEEKEKPMWNSASYNWKASQNHNSSSC